MAESQAKLVITAENRTATAFAGIKRDMEGVQAAAGKLNGVLGALGVTALGGGLIAAFNGVVRYRSELDDLSDITGDNVRNLDALAKIARQSGLEVGDLGGLLSKLAKSLGDSGEEGKTAQSALKAIGLSVADLRSQKPGEAFLEIAKALDGFADGADKVRVAQALLGREGAKALPFLKDLAEAGELNGRVTAEQAAQAERLEKSIRSLNGALGQTKTALVSELIPPLTNFVEAQREGIKIAGSFSEALRLFVFNLDAITSEKPREEIERLTAALKKFQDAGAVGRFIQSPTGAIFGGRESDLKKQIDFLRFLERQQALEKTGPQFLDARDLKAQQKPNIDFKGAPGAGGNQADPFADIMKRIAAERAGIESEKNFYVEIQTLLKEDKKLRESLTEEQRKKVLQAAAEVTQAKDLAEIRKEQQKYEEESARRAAERTRQLGAEADAIRDQLDPTRALFRELDRLDLLRKEGFITATEGREAARRAVEKLTTSVSDQQRLTVAANDSAQAFRDMGYTAASALEDILVKGGSARDILRALGQDLQRILIRQSVTKPLADTAGNFFANLFNKGPNTTTSRDFLNAIDLQGFATGGSFTVGGAGGTDSQLVAFRATPGEQVSIRTPGQQGGGGATYNIDARGADAGGLARLERTIRELHGSIERRAVAAVFNANVRGVRA